MVAAVDAITVALDEQTADYVAEFAQLTEPNAEAALALAEDLGLLVSSGAKFMPSSPLCRCFTTANQQRKATALRLALESYEPFTRFRERLVATNDAGSAAKQVKRLLDLDAHHDDIKETLLSLGQYSQALIAEGGGAYKSRDNADAYDLSALSEGCASDAASEELIRERLGQRASDKVSRSDVIIPLANAVQRARAGDGRGAVVSAGNAVESYLGELGARIGTTVADRHGINAKAEALNRNGACIPKKLLNISKYLGHVRNAADHGVDADINAAWDIREATGTEYVFVACSFIAAVTERELNGPAEL